MLALVRLFELYADRAHGRRSRMPAAESRARLLGADPSSFYVPTTEDSQVYQLLPPKHVQQALGVESKPARANRAYIYYPGAGETKESILPALLETLLLSPIDLSGDRVYVVGFHLDTFATLQSLQVGNFRCCTEISDIIHTRAIERVTILCSGPSILLAMQLANGLLRSTSAQVDAVCLDPVFAYVATPELQVQKLQCRLSGLACNRLALALQISAEARALGDACVTDHGRLIALAQEIWRRDAALARRQLAELSLLERIPSADSIHHATLQTQRLAVVQGTRLKLVVVLTAAAGRGSSSALELLQRCGLRVWATLRSQPSTTLSRWSANHVAVMTALDGAECPPPTTVARVDASQQLSSMSQTLALLWRGVVSHVRLWLVRGRLDLTTRETRPVEPPRFAESYEHEYVHTSVPKAELLDATQGNLRFLPTDGQEPEPLAKGRVRHKASSVEHARIRALAKRRRSHG